MPRCLFASSPDLFFWGNSFFGGKWEGVLPSFVKGKGEEGDGGFYRHETEICDAGGWSCEGL